MDRGLSDVILEDLLQMDSSMDYVEDENRSGIHISVNYTRDLRGAVLDLEVRDEPDPEFRDKSGDHALLGLVSTLSQELAWQSLTLSSPVGPAPPSVPA